MIPNILDISDNPILNGSDNPILNGEIRIANKIIPQCKVVFDVGSSDDLYYHSMNPKCKFYLFEPGIKPYACLLDKICKIRNEGKEEHIESWLMGLGESQKVVKYYPKIGSIYNREIIQNDGIYYDIVIYALDKFCELRNVNHIDFLKMDVEGNEYNVLLGGRGIILNNTDFVQFEYGGTYQDSQLTLVKMFEFFDGWFIYKIESDGIVIQNEPVEDYVYANFLACKCEFNENE